MSIPEESQMDGRKITALSELKSGWVLAACEDGTLWVNTSDVITGSWQEVQGPPAPEPGQWGTSKMKGPYR